jgi:hypothetical protein
MFCIYRLRLRYRPQRPLDGNQDYRNKQSLKAKEEECRDNDGRSATVPDQPTCATRSVTKPFHRRSNYSASNSVQWGVGSEGTLARSTTFDLNTCISSTAHPIRL